MKPAHTPTPWRMEPSSFDDELLILCDETCVAAIPVWEDDDNTDTLRAQSHANAAFIVRACNAHDGLATALKLALDALNAAPRFRVNDTDSYRIASHIEGALRLAEVNPYER